MDREAAEGDNELTEMLVRHGSNVRFGEMRTQRRVLCLPPSVSIEN